ncbi:MAG: alpha/beta hydrolase [Calditrichia bacterium]
MIRKYAHLSICFLIAFLIILIECSNGEETSVLSADSVRIEYITEGQGDPALVFVHGWCTSKKYWRYQLQHFAGKYKVVALDLAGHGKSGTNREDWSIPAFGQDVAAVVKSLQLNRVILIGHSMGGSVIIEAARLLQDKVIGLVGVDTYQNFDENITPDQIAQFLAPMRQNFPEAASTFVRSMFTDSSDTNLIRYIVNDISKAPPEIAIATLEAAFRYDPRLALKEMRLPIYSINSDKYPVNIEAGKKHAAAFNVKTMHGVGHFIQLEDAKTFNQLLEECIEELSH